MTDNGTQFTSAEFETFMKTMGYVTSNRLRIIQPVMVWLKEYFKESMKKFLNTKLLETRISRFLFGNHLTPHSTTRVPPAELLLGRPARENPDRSYGDL